MSAFAFEKEAVKKFQDFYSIFSPIIDKKMLAVFLIQAIIFLLTRTYFFLQFLKNIKKKIKYLRPSINKLLIVQRKADPPPQGRAKDEMVVV